MCGVLALSVKPCRACQLSQRESPWQCGKVSGSSAKFAGVSAPPGGAVAQRLRGFKSAEPEKTVKRSSRRTGVNLQFFPVEPTSLGLKGASSPFFVAPARRNRCDLAVLDAQHLLRKPVCDLKAPLGLSCLAGTAALFFSFGVKREHPSACAYNTKKRPALPVEMRGAAWFWLKFAVYSSILPKLKSAKSSTRSVRLGATGAALSASRGA